MIRVAREATVAAEEIASLFAGVTRLLHKRVREAMHRSEMPAAVPLLMHLAHARPGLTLSALGRAAGLSKSRTSVLVDRLTSHGLLEKRPDPDDQRLVRIHPTPRSPELQREMHAAYEGAVADLLAELSPAERSDLVAALRRMREAARRRGWWSE